MLQSHSILQFLIQYRYIALFPLALFEGPIVALAVGFLTRLGSFNFLAAFAVMLLGDFIPDSVFYFIGRFGNKDKLIKKYDTKSKIISQSLPHIKKFWHEHPTKTMFISKLAYGLSTVLLISAGVARVPYKRFIWQALIVTIFQYGILMTVGYYLGNSYQAALPYVKYMSVVVAGFAIIFIFGYFMLQRYMKNQVINLNDK
jgi:membrane protein DedA with SNARE-associated domain